MNKKSEIVFACPHVQKIWIRNVHLLTAASVGCVNSTPWQSFCTAIKGLWSLTCRLFFNWSTDVHWPKRMSRRLLYLSDGSASRVTESVVFSLFFSFGHALDWGRPSGSLIDSVLPETTSAVDRRRTGSLDSLFNLPRATLSHRVYSRRLDRPQTAPGQGAPFWCVESFSFQYCPLAFGCQKKQHRELHLTATKDLKDGQKQNLEG